MLQILVDWVLHLSESKFIVEDVSNKALIKAVSVKKSKGLLQLGGSGFCVQAI